MTACIAADGRNRIKCRLFAAAIGLPLFALTSKRLLESVLSLAEQVRLASETSLTSCVDRRLESANREGLFGPPVKIK